MSMMSLLSQYQTDLAAVAGVEWSKTESSSLRMANFRPNVNTIPDFPPGYACPTYPTTLEELGVVDSTAVDRTEYRAQLLRVFDRSVDNQDWSLALRCAIIAELVRRTARIHAAKGGDARTEFESHGGMYASTAPQMPPLPEELRPVFHGMSYGGEPMDVAFMQAIGVRPLARSTAGFEPWAPLHVVVRARNIRTKRTVNVPAVVAKAWLSDAPMATPIELVAACRPLVMRCDGEESPLRSLEVRVMACIPSGRLWLSTPSTYQHLFGVENDTRHFWLTAYHTDRHQYPCAVVFPHSLSENAASMRWDATLEAPRRRTLLGLRSHLDDEEGAMLQVMLGVWGIDRMFVGREMRWRTAAGAADDDHSLFDERVPMLFPEWIPALPCRPQTPSPLFPPVAEPLLFALSDPSLEDESLLALWDDIFLGEPLRFEPEPNIVEAPLFEVTPIDEAPPPKRPRVDVRPAMAPDECHAMKGRIRSFRGSGRLAVRKQAVVDWAMQSLETGILGGGTCASVCQQDPPGRHPRASYSLTPGVVIGIIDTIMTEAVSTINAMRA